MLGDSLRNGGVMLEEVEVFVHRRFGNGIEKPVLGKGKITLHHDPEHPFKLGNPGQQFFFGCRAQRQDFAIFERFYKKMTGFLV